MNPYLSFGLLCFTSFFSLINPMGIMPVFISMTSELEEAQRHQIAKKAGILAFIVLVVFAFSGQLLFNFFHISVHSFRIVGGIIFFIVGFDMLQARIGKIKVTESEIVQFSTDISITPLAIPILAGPGAITNSIILMEQASSPAHKAILISAILLVLLIAVASLYGAARITRFLGETGNKILMRIMGLIIMVIAVEYFFSGLEPILKRIFNLE